MLTRQHRFARRIMNKDERLVYQTHMCGLCHALGDDYGLASRLVTNHDMVLLNMLITAQCEEESETLARRCPLNPLIKVPTSQGTSDRFSAAVAIALAKVGLADNIQDSNGWNLKAQFLNGLVGKSHLVALETLSELGFDTKLLIELAEQQTSVEQDQNRDPASPSAQVSAAIFAMTTHLANNPSNTEPLAEIGANHGSYIYLKDALRDYPHDMARHEYNPFRRFSTQSNSTLVLSRDGLVWAQSRFEGILAAIKENVPRLCLYHSKNAVTRLLCEPILQTISNISHKIETCQDGLVFKQWYATDALKAAAFAVPIAIAVGSATVGYDGCDIVGTELSDQIVAADSDDCVTICGLIGCAAMICGGGTRYVVVEERSSCC